MAVYYEWLNLISNEEFEFKNLEKLKILEELPRAKEIKMDKYEQLDALEWKIRNAIKELN